MLQHPQALECMQSPSHFLLIPCRISSGPWGFSSPPQSAASGQPIGAASLISSSSHLPKLSARRAAEHSEISLLDDLLASKDWELCPVSP